MVMGKMLRFQHEVSYSDVQVDVGKLIEGRYKKLLHAMNKTEVDALIVSGAGGPAQYATGARVLTADSGRTDAVPIIAVVRRDGTPPYVFTPDPNGVPPHIPSDHIYPPVYLAFREGVDHFGKVLQQILGPAASGRIGIDIWSIPVREMVARFLPKAKTVNYYPTWLMTKGARTKEELQCIRISQKLAEHSLLAILPHVRPGMTETELAGIYNEELLSRGTTNWTFDPIISIQPCHGSHVPRRWPAEDILNREVTGRRPLMEGDVLMLDFGVNYLDYATDICRTWYCGEWTKPTQAQKDVFKRYQEIVWAMYEVCKPGKTAWDLRQAGLKAWSKGPRNWPRLWRTGTFIAHSVGLMAAADHPFIGTNLGEQYERNFALVPDLPLNIEPHLYYEGVLNYREENLLVITETGAEMIMTLPYGLIGEGIPSASEFFQKPAAAAPAAPPVPVAGS